MSWTMLLGTLNSIIIYCIFTFKTKSKKNQNYIAFYYFFLLYGLNWNVVFAFLKSLFTINVTQYMKRKLSTCNTQCTKTTSKMNTIGGWIIKGGSFSQHKPLTWSKLWYIWFLYLIQNQYSVRSHLDLNNLFFFHLTALQYPIKLLQ